MSAQGKDLMTFECLAEYMICASSLHYEVCPGKCIAGAYFSEDINILIQIILSFHIFHDNPYVLLILSIRFDLVYVAHYLYNLYYSNL